MLRNCGHFESIDLITDDKVYTLHKQLALPYGTIRLIVTPWPLLHISLS